MKKIPTLRRHKSTGHAYARFEGQQYWFGPYDDQGTHERFLRAVAEWKANGYHLPEDGDGLTVADVVARYLAFAEGHYVRQDGTPTREVEHLRVAVAPLLALYRTLPANEFGLRQLKTLREQLVDHGLGRKTINDRINRLVRMFRWAASEELCEPRVFEALRVLGSLPRGRSKAKESKEVRPVPRKHVEAVLPHVSRQVAGMIELIWHTGMRPGEARQLRPMDLDTSGAVWLYRPASHKTERFGRERVIPIGPRGQAVLRPFLSRIPRPSPASCVFSPRDAMAECGAARREGGGASPRQVAYKRKRRPKKQPGEMYSRTALGSTIRRVCLAEGIPVWAPNQLRHAAGTRIRKARDLETARTVLGHTSAATTAIYAERDLHAAMEVAAELG